MNFIRRISSRKFIALVIGVGLHLLNPQHFTGEHVLILIGVFIGGNVAQKFLEKMK